MVPHHRGCSSFFFFLFVIFLVPKEVEGGLYQPPSAPTRDQCLYFSDDNGFAEVLKVDPVQGALVEASLANSSTTNLTDKGVLNNVLPNVGYYAGSLTIYKDILYVVSLRWIARYDVMNNLQRLDNFLEFIFLPYPCLPDGIFIWNEVLYVSCGAFTNLGSNNTYPLLKFSVADADYGTFLNGTGYPSATIGYLFFYHSAVMNGTFRFSDYFTGAVFNASGAFAVFSGLDALQAVPLTNDSSHDAPNKLFDMAWDTFFYKYYVTVPENVTSLGGENWPSFTWGEDGNIYLLRTYPNAVDGEVGDVLVMDGTDFTYLYTLVQPTTELHKAKGITMSPTGDFLVAAEQNGPSSILVFDKTTGERKGVFFSGTPGNDILPKNMIWGRCPVIPPEPTSEDNTLAIVLGTVIPVLALPTCCVILVILLLIIFLLVKEINDRRRKTYLVHDDDRVQMGRRGKTVFTYREIDPDELEIGQLLGQGAYGKVYKGTFRGAPVAIKTFDQIKLDEADEETLAEIREEAQMMERLGNHPNVISFVGAITNPSQKGHQLYFSLVTEYCPNGSLFDFLIKKKTKIPLITLIKMARDIAAGILHLHKERVIHRDIATRNILVGNDLNVYLSDFGMARIKQQDVNTTMANVGPVKWMAPESIMHKQYSEASDAFSYGVTLWEMITRKVPWKGMDVAQIVIAVAQKNTRLEVPSDADPILKNIIKSVWRSVPEKRMRMSEIVSKLDTYYKSLLEVYEEMSSDDDLTTDRSYFKNNSIDGRSSRSTLLGAGGRKVTSSPSLSTEENATEMSEMSFSYATINTEGMTSAEPLSSRREKGKEKETGKGKGKGKGKENYGEIPEQERNYGEIPEQEKNYGNLPSDLHGDYASFSAKKNNRGLL